MRKVLTVALVFMFGAVSVNAADTSSNSVASSASVVDPPAEPTLPAEQSAQPQSSDQTNPTRHKSIATTVLLWLVVPGGGNFYAGDKTKGFLELGASVAGLALMANSLREQCSTSTIGRSVYTACGEETSPGKFWGGFGAMTGVRVWGLITAIKRTNDINSGKLAALERLRFALPTKKEGFKVAYNFSF